MPFCWIIGITTKEKICPRKCTIRLSAAWGTHPSFWFDMQSSYEFAQAMRKKIPKIVPFSIAA